MAGTTNVTIEKIIEEENDDLKRNFVGVFSSNSVTPFINLYGPVKKKSSTHPFAILITDRNNLPGTQWWSILNIYPSKQLLLFDSYGFTGLKAFIMQDDRNIINKILCGVEKFNKKDNIVLPKFKSC